MSILTLILIFSCNKEYDEYELHGSYIRLNMIGYNTNDTKIAVIGSQKRLHKKKFKIVEADNPKNVVYKGKIGEDRGSRNTPFDGNFTCDFSDFTTPGRYILKINRKTISEPFTIGAKDEYKDVLAKLLEFYRSQRCGDTDPLLHKPCHLNDAKAVIDASGGWHDAGDYIKFMITSTFIALNLVTTIDYGTAYDQTGVFQDISPANSIPDIVEEARVGLEWILKMTVDYDKGNYYYQMSGAEDHDHWRMPESDDRTGVTGNPRKIRAGWGGNLLGRSAASLAIAARIFEADDPDFAKKCLERAVALYADKANYENAKKSDPNDFYDERGWQDDVVLAAAELYNTTGDREYFDYASQNLQVLKQDGINWFSTDFLAYAACYRYGIEKGTALMKMKAALNKSARRSDGDVYYLSSGYSWGTSAEYTADAQKAIMYYYLTDDTQYLEMAQAQRDYLLGRNNWGISFIIGVGHTYPENPHSQIHDYAGPQVGAVVGGPAESKDWRGAMSHIKYFEDRFTKFQSNIIYHDYSEDYYTNEVANDYNACSVFMFMFFANGV